MNMETLMSAAGALPVGMMAFVTDQELLYVRVKDGLKFVEVKTFNI